MFRWINKRLSYQLLFNIILVFILLIAAFSTALILFVSKTTERELINRLNKEVKLASREVEMLFDNASSRVRQLSLDLTVQTYLKEVETREDVKNHPLYPIVLNNLTSISKSNQNVFLAWIANEKANFYLDSRGTIPNGEYVISARPWYAVAMGNEEVSYTEPYIEWGTGELVISAIKPLSFDSTKALDNKNVYGFSVIDFNVSSLPNLLSNIDVGDYGRVLVVDKNGFYINETLDFKPLEMNIKNDTPELYKVFSDWDKNSNIDKANIEESTSKVTIDRKDYIVYKKRITPLGWTVLCIVDSNTTQTHLREFLSLLSLGAVLSILLMSLVLNRIIQNKLKPVGALNDYAHAIANGELDEEPPYVYTTRLDEMGDMARAFVTITEVFRQKNSLLEEVVTSQYQEIQQQYKYILEKEKIASLGTLVAGVAHEINTPLGVGVTTASYIESTVNNLSEIYQDKHLSASRLEQDIKSLQDATTILTHNLKRAADLVTQFKAISTNQSRIELTTFHLRAELDMVISSLRPTFKHRKIEIVNQIDKIIYLTSFAGAFNQIFTNLIMNSMHHAFDEDHEGIITVQGRAEGELVRLIYQDNGKGIEKEVIDHIFEPFYTTRRSGGNSGLGMFIIHNLVTQSLSGTIHIESALGYGVKFMITVPMHLKVDD